MTNFAPFEIYENGGTFRIKAEIERLPEYLEYMELFASHDYEPNGYCWESHIIQTLEKENPDLLNHIEFDPEAGGFYAVADSKQSQLDFVNTLSPIFQDRSKLEKYIRSADRSRIDD
ncbi:Imm51 family immunity protein [Larkinella insperata]|uniref:Imm51 family immunity protein n=1 Tax=Larkinella insperata TaxID=332158 RepID=A0ABW3QH55_9BACT